MITANEILIICVSILFVFYFGIFIKTIFTRIKTRKNNISRTMIVNSPPRQRPTPLPRPNTSDLSILTGSSKQNRPTPTPRIPKPKKISKNTVQDRLNAIEDQYE